LGQRLVFQRPHRPHERGALFAPSVGCNPMHEEALMKLRKLAKDPGSQVDHCPAVYVAEDDPTVIVVQGKLLDPDTTQSCTIRSRTRRPSGSRPTRWCARSSGTSPSA